jgi:hypothetical protein
MGRNSRRADVTARAKGEEAMKRKQAFAAAALGLAPETLAFKRMWGAYGNKPDDKDLGPYNPDAPPVGLVFSPDQRFL